MKKAVLMAAAIVAVAPAQAGWDRVFSDEERVHYIDASTLRVVGKTRRLWLLDDFRRPDRDGYLSKATLAEIDCDKERMRYLEVVAYKTAMASGPGRPNSEVPTAWGYFPPRTQGAVMVKSFCSIGQ